MAISYNLVMANRRRYPITYVCFGLLNKFNSIRESHFDQNSTFYKGEVYHRTFSNSVSDLVAVEYNYKRDAYRSSSIWFETIVDKYQVEVKKFLKAFPWVKEVAALNKKLGVVRVKAKGIPADKVMFVLTSIRNILCEVNEQISWENYRIERHAEKMKLMPDYRTFWIYDNLMYDVPRRDWSAGGAILRWDSDPKFNSESNVINSATFGKASLKRLISGEEPKWYQDNFEDTHNGYVRDSYYEEFNESFGTDEYLHDVDEYYVDDVDGRCSGRLLYRTMADSLSTGSDQDCIFRNGEFDDYVGFVFDGCITTEEAIADYLEVIKGF